MITLYMVRHAQSVDNLEGRISGQSDPLLSSLGVRQAEAVADRLGSVELDALYSSDLARAVRTVEPLAAALRMPITTTGLLREAHMGEAQGLTRAGFEGRFPDEMRRWREDPVTYRPPGGEPVEDVIDRCLEFLKELQSSRPAGAVVAAAVHLGSLRGLICAALELPAAFYPRFYAANASVSALGIGARSCLSLLNDICHLERVRPDDHGEVRGS